MPKKNRKKNNKQTIVVRPLELTPLENEIKQFAELKEEESRVVLIRAKTLKARSETEKLNPIYEVMIYSRCAVEGAKISAEQCMQALNHACNLFSAAPKDPQTHLYSQTILVLFNKAFMNLLHALTNDLMQPAMAGMLNTMLADYPDEVAQLSRQLDVATKTEALRENMRHLSEVTRQIDGLITNLQPLGKNLIGTELNQSICFLSLLKIIDTCYFQAYTSVLVNRHRFEDPYAKETLEFLLNLALTSSQQLTQGIQWYSTPASRHKEMKLIIFATRLLLIRAWRSKLVLTLVSKLNEYIVRPWSKKENEWSTISLIEQFNFDLFSLQYELNKGVVDTKPYYKSLSKLVEQNKEAQEDHGIHIAYVRVGMLHLCGNIIRKYSDVIKFRDKKELGPPSLERLKTTEQGPATLLNHAMHLNLLHDAKDIMEKIQKSLSYLNSHAYKSSQIIFFPLPSIQVFFIGVLNTLLPIESLQPIKKEVQDLTDFELAQWYTTLIDLQRIYQSINSVLDYFINHSSYFLYSDTILDSYSLSKKNISTLQVERLDKEIKRVSLLQEKKSAALSKTEYISIGNELIKKEEENKRRIEEKMKERRSKAVQSTTVTFDKRQEENDEDAFSRDVCEDNAPYYDELALPIIERAIQALVKQQYNLAFGEYQSLEAVSKDYRAAALDGKLTCKTKLLSQKLDECIDVLERITINPQSISFNLARNCYTQTGALKKDYDVLLSEQEDIRKEWKLLLEKPTRSQEEQNCLDGMRFSLLVWEEGQKELAEKWSRCEETKINAQQEIKASRFKKVMLFGLEAEEIANSETCENLFNVGYRHQVLNDLTDERNETNDFVQYQTVFNSGLKLFFACSEKKKRAFGKSIYTLHRELLNEFDNILKAPSNISASYQGKQPFVSSISASTVNSIVHPPIEATTTTTRTSSPAQVNIFNHADDVLKLLSQLQSLTDTDFENIRKWSENRLKIIQRQGYYEKTFSPAAAYEFLCSWLIHPQLEEHYSSLENLGLVDLCIASDEESRRCRVKNQAQLLSFLKLIGEQIEKIPLTDRKQDLILAQLLSGIVFFSYSPELLKENLSKWTSKSLPLYSICQNLQLTQHCQGNLHALLTGRLATENSKASSASSVIVLLRNIALVQVRRLINEANIQEEPWYVYKYGSDALAPLIMSLEHKPNDQDVRTNIPVDHLPACVINPNLLALHIYHPKVPGKEGEIDRTLSIKIDQKPLLIALQDSDFTVHFILFDLLLEHHVYWSREATVDLEEQKLRSIFPFERLQQDPQRFLRFLISGVNYKFYATNENTEQLRTFAAVRLTIAKNNGLDFLSPIFDAARLQHFFFARLSMGESAPYITLAIHYDLFGFLFPIPIQALPLPIQVTKEMERALQQIDQEKLSNPSLDKVSILARVIVTVLHYSINALPDRQALHAKVQKEILHSISHVGLKKCIQRELTRLGKNQYRQKISMFPSTALNVKPSLILAPPIKPAEVLAPLNVFLLPLEGAIQQTKMKAGELYLMKAGEVVYCVDATSRESLSEGQEKRLMACLKERGLGFPASNKEKPLVITDPAVTKVIADSCHYVPSTVTQKLNY